MTNIDAVAETRQIPNSTRADTCQSPANGLPRAFPI